MNPVETMPAHPASSQSDNSPRIESLRQQIATGSYRVDPNALADALIRHLQQNPRRRVA